MEGLSGILCPCAVSQYEDEILGRSLGFGAALDTGDKEYKVGNSRLYPAPEKENVL